MGNDDSDAPRRMAGLATSMALRVAVTLGLPDRLRAAATAARLAAELGVHPIALDLLLGHRATLGVVERTTTGYRTTDFGAHLCADADSGLANLLHLESAAGRAELAFVELPHSIATGEAAYPRRHGHDFWADLAAHPQLRETFDRQMNHRFRAEIPQVLAGIDWSRFSTVVDVGGGHGTLLAAILTAHPRLRGHLVDLEPTATGARETFRANGLTDRTGVTGASFFDRLPAGAGAYLLVDIPHNWDDEHAHRILARCAQAARPAGRVLVVEAVGGLHAGTEMDLVMLVHHGGRERRADEFRTLAAAHGLVLEKAIALTGRRGLLEFRAAAPRRERRRSGVRYSLDAGWLVRQPWRHGRPPAGAAYRRAAPVFAAARAVRRTAAGTTGGEPAPPDGLSRWTVHDVAAHVLGDHVGRLSAHRDGCHALRPARRRSLSRVKPPHQRRMGHGGAPDQPGAADRPAGHHRRAGRRVLARHRCPGRPVSWAGPAPAPTWLDAARDFTEYWVHHQQISEATARPGPTRPEFLAPVLDTFLRALPHTLRNTGAAEGIAAEITITGPAGGTRTCVRTRGRWALQAGGRPEPAAAVRMDAGTAWRLCTRGITPHQAKARAVTEGDRHLAQAALTIVSIIH